MACDTPSCKAALDQLPWNAFALFDQLQCIWSVTVSVAVAATLDYLDCCVKSSSTPLMLNGQQSAEAWIVDNETER